MTKSLEDQLKEDKAYWTCTFCDTKNLGTLSRCKKCDGVRTTA